MLPSILQGTIVKVVCAGNGDDVAIIELVDRPGTMIRMPVGTVTPHLLPTRKEGGGVRERWSDRRALFLIELGMIGCRR